MAIASLETTLESLKPYLMLEEVSELSINRPNEIWLDDGVKCQYKEIDFPLRLLNRLSQLVAAHTKQELSPHRPLLSASLPEGYRIQAVISPATQIIKPNQAPQDTVSLSIRKQTLRDFDLNSYARQGGFSFLKGFKQSEAENQLQLNDYLEQEDYVNLLSHCVQQHKTILISGGTFSGKTSILNMLLKEIPIYERIITIEDVPEVILSQPNHVRLFYSRGEQGISKVTATDLINAALRMRPDRIIMGELRGDDALTWLSCANSGHAGTISTIHADTPQLAIDKLIDMVKFVRPHQSDEVIRRYIMTIVDVIVQVKRNLHTGERYMADLLCIKK
jgi:type IV secretion system protein VirB11